jgi:peroxiredoxin
VVNTIPPSDTSALDDAPNPAAHEHGRIGYGTYARFTPLGIGIAQRRPDGDTGHAGRLIGQPAPGFTLTLLDGGTLRLADLRGSAVALNFWAAWCAPCKSELPRFQAIAADASRSGESIAIVGVGIKNDYDANARALVADLGLTFPIGRDTAGDDPIKGPIETAYGIANYPTTVFIRPDGAIAAIHIGELDEAQIRAYLDDAKQSAQ